MAVKTAMPVDAFTPIQFQPSRGREETRRPPPRTKAQIKSATVSGVVAPKPRRQSNRSSPGNWLCSAVAGVPRLKMRPKSAATVFSQPAIAGCGTATSSTSSAPTVSLAGFGLCRPSAPAQVVIPKGTDANGASDGNCRRDSNGTGQLPCVLQVAAPTKVTANTAADRCTQRIRNESEFALYIQSMGGGPWDMHNLHSSLHKPLPDEVESRGNVVATETNLHHNFCPMPGFTAWFNEYDINSPRVRGAGLNQESSSGLASQEVTSPVLSARLGQVRSTDGHCSLPPMPTSPPSARLPEVGRSNQPVPDPATWEEPASPRDSRKSPTPPSVRSGVSWRHGPSRGHGSWNRRCRWSPEEFPLECQLGFGITKEGVRGGRRRRSSKDKDKDKDKDKEKEKNKRVILPFWYPSEDPRFAHVEEVSNLSST